tara:strand:+ start:3177 stop:3830 length:654 start_codon:yes stop_codon:yes gene_type:complete
MLLSLNPKELSKYVSNHLNFFDDSSSIKKNELLESIEITLEKLTFCFDKINIKYFNNGNDSIFNHLNSDQYAMFLYTLSNVIYKKDMKDNISIATKIYLLNKTLHGIDIFYEINLPKIFIFIHPLGTVLGRANYSDYFAVYQRCGIGSNNDSYPKLGKYLTLHPGASVLGKSKIEDNCSIGTDSLVLDRNIKKNSIYIGNPMLNKILKKTNIDTIWK